MTREQYLQEVLTNYRDLVRRICEGEIRVGQITRPEPWRIIQQGSTAFPPEEDPLP